MKKLGTWKPIQKHKEHLVISKVMQIECLQHIALILLTKSLKILIIIFIKKEQAIQQLLLICNINKYKISQV